MWNIVGTVSKFLETAWSLDDFANSDEVTLKEDATHVGKLDKRIEGRILAFLQECFPTHDIVSEEATPQWPPRTKNFWVVDPVDGTSNHSWEMPNFGTMLALVQDGILSASVVFLPEQHLLGVGGIYVAVRGRGSWRMKRSQDGVVAIEPIHVSTQNDFLKAHVFFEGSSRKVMKSSLASRAMQVARRSRLGFSSCWAGTRVAAGGNLPVEADALISVDNKPWDNLALCLLIEEAGGKVTDFNGKPWSLENCSRLVFSNGFLHDQIVGLDKKP